MEAGPSPQEDGGRRVRRSLDANPLTVVRRVARPVAFVVIGLAVAILLCGLAGAGMRALGYVRPGIDDLAEVYLLISALITGVSGGLLYAWGDDIADLHLTRRDAVVVTSLVWLSAGLFGALPYLLGAGMSPADALFESISGFTTTGATVVTRIEEDLSRPLLLWRSLTQWLGGMGIIVLFIAVFPGLGAGGKNLFRTEFPGPTADTLRPRMTDTAFYLWVMYVGLTVLEALLLVLCGMEVFEAVCHALTTVSSGGFSTRDDSIAAFDSPTIELVIVIFMLASGVNFGLYYAAVRFRRLGVFLRSVEFRVYIGVFVVVALAFTLLNLRLHDGDVVQSLRYSVFTAAAFVSSTCYGVEDYMGFGAPALLLVLAMMFMGGSAGSTSGGIKISRVLVAFKSMFAVVKNQVRPNVVQVVRLGRQVQPAQTLLEVLAFIAIFVVSLGAGTLVVAVLEPGATLPSAFGAVLSCLSNMGPAPFHPQFVAGEGHLGGDDFSRYSDLAKLFFSGVMVFGRLEFLTVLALFLPEVWRP